MSAPTARCSMPPSGAFTLLFKKTLKHQPTPSPTAIVATTLSHPAKVEARAASGSLQPHRNIPLKSPANAAIADSPRPGRATVSPGQTYRHQACRFRKNLPHLHADEPTSL